jgi:diphthine-ammonia ligase
VSACGNLCTFRIISDKFFSCRDEVEIVIHSEAAFASVSYLRIKTAHLEDKDPACVAPLICPPELDELSEEIFQALRKLHSSAPESTSAPYRHLSDEVAAFPSSSSTPNFARKGDWFSLSNITATTSTSLDSEVESLFASLESTLSSHNLSSERIQHVNLYLRSMADFAQVNAIYKTQFGSAPPSRACIAIGPALWKTAVMEVMGWQRSEKTGSDGMETRKALHVQGRSYWAPANIGPYSQSVIVSLFRFTQLLAAQMLI